MDFKLKGKTALVTGSSKGIGFATASLLAQEGAKVFINGRTEQSVNAALKKLKKNQENANVIGMAMDLSTASGCESLTQAVPNVDILVNNLGIFNPVPFEKISDQEWEQFFQTNIMSGVRLSRHYLSGMSNNNWGRIVFISSESAIQIPEEMIHYGMTKSAQIAIARGLAETTKGTGVTVNSVLPGPTRSEGVETFVQTIADQEGLSFEEMETEFFKSGRPSSLIQRFANVEEVANMIVYVCSPLSSATNGAALRVDGGVVRSAF